VKATVGFVLGLIVAVGLWPLLRSMLSAPAFERENHRGRHIPTAAGLVVVLATLGSIALWSAYDTIRDGPRLILARSFATAALVVTGFGLFGLLDDLVGRDDRRGFSGHLAAIGRGELTTGMLKLVGGGLVAVVVAAPWSGDSFSRLVVAAVVVALAANLGNLLDRGPGRVEKVSLAAFVILAASSGLAVELTGPAIVAGAGAGMLVPDLRERCMVGDTGANVLGAAAGLGLVATTGRGVQAAVAIVLLGLNVASEFVSFSRVIDRTPPLRWVDRLGAPPR
jgi:UDP-GlcNAc:undecaprenyl-phosphate GlcNAc-1-phosphate transferase